VILFTLLLSSGLGSLSTGYVNESSLRQATLKRAIILLLLLVIVGTITPVLTRQFQGATTPARILVSVLLLFPLGLFMGTLFPLGIKTASRVSGEMTPMLWAVNGAMSIIASVVAVVISLGATISATYWTGFGCYVCVALAQIAIIKTKYADKSATKTQ
jgi:hypothetical protein